jgi:hypothetical protein
MTRPTFDPDVTRRDDGPYWAAAMVLAIKAGDRVRIEAARQNLRRLGYRLDVTRPTGKGKAVGNVR